MRTDINPDDGKYTYLDTQTHAYLVVPMNEVLTLELADEISEYSYTDGTTVYLEEDLDAWSFCTAYAYAKDEPLRYGDIKYITAEKWQDKLKSLERFNPRMSARVVGYGEVKKWANQ